MSLEHATVLTVRTLSRRLEVPRALRAFVRARESSLLFLGAACDLMTSIPSVNFTPRMTFGNWL
jgi:hypothetical protein